MIAPRAIVKLGGSHAFGPHLHDWLEAIAREAGLVVIVPGGGPFADAVRAAQPAMGFDDEAAHAMALMAMAQFGRALQPQSGLRAGRTRAEIAASSREAAFRLVAGADGARRRRCRRRGS